jgi:limonene-1,2-epoxide hydrolase
MTPIETVEAFLAKLGEPGGFAAAVTEWFTPETVYENIGMSRTVGIDEALAFVAEFERGFGASAIRVETLAICAAGNTVLTERIDYVLDAKGATTATIPLMGAFELADGRITAWRDYFDTRANTA